MEIPGYIPETVNCHACGAAIPLAGQTGFAHVPCPQCQAVAVVPVRFGQYLLLSPLGIGGMGTVYKAVDLPLRRYCAVKLVHAETPANPAFIDRFTREARAAAAVNHGNIAQVYSFGQHRGQYYLAMELLEKGSLDNRIHTAGALDEQAALVIGRQIATGLRAALQRGLLHLDIKPANILFNLDGDPKLVDFGLAHLQEKSKPALHRPADPAAPVATPTAGQAVWGTPYYVSPEKLHGQSEDFRSDIYSLGATLFHALTGRPPLESEIDPGQQPKRQIAAVKSLRPALHTATVQLISRMLAKNPADRPGSYDELIRIFDTALGAFKIPGVATPPTGRKTSRRNAVVVGIVILTGVAGGIVARWQPWRSAVPASTAAAGTPRQSPKPPIPVAPPPLAVAATVGKANFQGDEPWAKAWEDATLEFAQAKYTEALQGYQATQAKLTAPEQADARQWVALFQGLTQIALDHNDEAQNIFTGALGTNPAAATLAGPLLQLGAGQLTPAQLSDITKHAPAWAAGLTQLVIGFERVGARQFAEAATAFRRYAELPKTEEQAWAFYLQPLAAKLAAECAAPAEIAALETAQKFPEALDKLRAVQDQATLPFVRPALAGREAALQAGVERQRAEAALVQEEIEKKRRAEEERQRQQAEIEARLLQQLDQSLTGTWKRYEFQPTRAKYAALKPKLQSESAQKELARRELLVGLLADFKAQLAADFAAKPSNVPPLTGQLARATETEVFFRTPYGEITGAWTELSPEVLVKIAANYAAILGQAEPKEALGRRYLLLTVFCRQYGLTRSAPAYAELMEKATPALKEQLTAAFPSSPATAN
jgi:hypothetical protein